jgi:hypothetical protein
MASKIIPSRSWCLLWNRILSICRFAFSALISAIVGRDMLFGVTRAFIGEDLTP